MVIYRADDHSSTPVQPGIPEITVFDNSNIQKCYSGVTTPLTFNFTKRAHATAYRQTMQQLSLPSKTIEKTEDIIQNLLGLVKGRIFYNTNNWYKGLKLLPSFNQNKRDMERLMGFTESLDLEEDMPESFWKKVGQIPGSLANLSRLLLAFHRLKKEVPEFLEKKNHYYTKFYSLDFDSMSIEALKAEKERLDANLSLDASTPIINDFYVMMAIGSVARNLKRAGIENPEEFLDLLLSVDHSSTIMQPAQHLHRLALQAAAQPELKMLINRLPDDIHKQVQVRFKAFHDQVTAFITTFGDRAVGELKLETQTMRQSPFIFYSYLRDCLSAQISEFRGREQSQTRSFSELNRKLNSIHYFHKVWTLRKLAKLKKAIGYREVFKLERSRMIGMYRTLYNAMGRQFDRNNWIEKPEDIFYLTEEEILSSGNGKEYRYKKVIAERRLEFETYKAEEVPSRVIMLYPSVTGTIIDEELKLPTVKKSTSDLPDFVFGQAS
jgi:pyruvate,water dikinase